MGILDSWQQKERDRINTLFDKIDLMTESQVDDFIKYVFESFYDAGFAGKMAAEKLIVKVNKVLKIQYRPQVRGEFDNWHKEFKAIPFSIKKALLVTVANDLCKLNIFNETQVMEKVDEFLKDIPGVLADAREFDGTANINDNKGE